MKNIYSDLKGEIIIFESGTRAIYLYDSIHNRYSPALVIPNKLAVENMIKFLKEKLKEMKENDF